MNESETRAELIDPKLKESGWGGEGSKSSVNAFHHFADPEWDGEPADPSPPIDRPTPPTGPGDETGDEVGEGGDEYQKKTKVKITLADGKEREIQHMVATSFMSADGKPISAQEFLHNLFGTLPGFFNREEELRQLWSNPLTRKTLLERLSDAGYGKDELDTLQKLINAEKSDLFDVLEYVAFALTPITREMRVAGAQNQIFHNLGNKQKEFLEFVLSKYIETGVGELDQEKLPSLLQLKYHAITDATEELGGVSQIRELFIEFQKYLYKVKVA